MDRAIAASEPVHLAAADYDFHSTIIAAGENQLFSAIYRVLRSFMYEEMEKSHRDFADIRVILQEHREFAEAIRTGETAQAAAVVRKHIASIKRRLGNVLRK
jgi:DNA-binding FadR family transcriptional regulator